MSGKENQGGRGSSTSSGRPSGFVVVGRLSDFPEGRAVACTVGARSIVIYRSGGELFALKDICPHMGDALHRLPPSGSEAVCIGHGWRFDLRTGHCTKGDPQARVAVYPVQVNGDTVLVGVDR